MFNEARKAEIIAIGLFLLCGCHSPTQKQLEHSARTWYQVIRASQVIPVYPLTQDLQPGDLFFVTKPIEIEPLFYEASGYYPLDRHIGRLNFQGYASFYSNSFLHAEKSAALPYEWAVATNGWEKLPKVAFPTYTFISDSKAKATVGMPIQSTQIGLMALRAKSVRVTVSIRNARTYGVDIISAYRDLKNWSTNRKVGAIDFLRHYTPKSTRIYFPFSKSKTYVRVVCRVYLAQELYVYVRNESTNKIDVSAEVDKLLKKTSYGNVSIEKIGASDDSIFFREKLAAPMVFGYMGFDCRIGKDGDLGYPMPLLVSYSKSPVSAPFNIVGSTFSEASRITPSPASIPFDLIGSIFTGLGKLMSPPPLQPRPPHSKKEKDKKKEIEEETSSAKPVNTSFPRRHV